LTEVSKFADFQLKINFPVLGKRLPAKMKGLIAASKQGDWKRVDDGRVQVADEVLEPEECSLLLAPKDEKAAQALSTQDALVLLDLEISESLKAEGIARDVVRLIQQSRKEADFAITDRITLSIDTDQITLQQACEAFNDYIIEQTLADSLELGKAKGKAHISEHQLEGAAMTLGMDIAS